MSPALAGGFLITSATWEAPLLGKYLLEICYNCLEWERVLLDKVLWQDCTCMFLSISKDSFIDKQASMLWEGILRRLDSSLELGFTDSIRGTLQ